MIRPLLAFAGCLVAGLLLYPALISTLARLRAGQRVQAYVPASHRGKAGTPTMGGVLFCTLPLVAWAILDHSRAGFIAVFAVVAGAAIGVVDDLANIRGRGALGLLGRQKLALQALVGLLLGLSHRQAPRGLARLSSHEVPFMAAKRKHHRLVGRS